MPVLLNTKVRCRAPQAGGVLDIETLYFATYLSHQTTNNFAWADFYEVINTFPDQQLHRLQPAYWR